jgi:hypothetical protein
MKEDPNRIILLGACWTLSHTWLQPRISENKQNIHNKYFENHIMFYTVGTVGETIGQHQQWATPFMWGQKATVRAIGNTFSKTSCVAHWSHPLYCIIHDMIFLKKILSIMYDSYSMNYNLCFKFAKNFYF